MISKDDFMAVAVLEIDDHFPKGKALERGQAMVLLAHLLQYLQEHGAVEA